MKSVRRVPIVVAAIALAAIGCATTTNPVTGQRELQGMTTREEIAIGQRAAEQVASEMGLVERPALRTYVRELGQRLAQFSPRRDVPFTFDVVQMAEPNAFALPGGHVYVSRGLLAIANSEDELAGVIGHEIGHVAARHFAQRQTRSQAVGIATVLGTLAAAALGGGQAAQAVNQFGQVAGSGLIASYGRDQERQADEVGQRIAAAAGYDPAAIGDFLETLGRETTRETGRARQPSFFDSHPSTPERVRNTRTRATRLRPAPHHPIAASRRAFLDRLDGLALGADPAQGVFQDRRFLQPDMGFAIDFPVGWRTVNAADAVGAQHPEGVALVKLQAQQPQGDVRDAADRFAAQAELTLEQAASIRVGGLPAWRAYSRASNGNIAQFTWVAFRGTIYRIDGIAKAQAYASVRDDLDRAARSFRALTARERAGIRERTLRVVAARARETLVALGRRTGNVWTPKQTAIANGVGLDVRFPAGFAVKIAQERPYRGAR